MAAVQAQIRQNAENFEKNSRLWGAGEMKSARDR